MSDSKIYLDKRNRSTYIRKRRWDKDSGKMIQETLHKFDNRTHSGTPPKTLPDNVILTESELKQYNDIVEKAEEKMKKEDENLCILLLRRRLLEAVNATVSQENLADLQHEELEELADLAGKLKIQINKHKNKLKKKKRIS